MNPSKSPASGEPSTSKNGATNDQLALADHLSDVTQDCRLEVSLSRQLSSLLHINQLNEKCFLNIFSRFPLQDQLHLRIVCSKWQEIIERKCRRQRSLKLFRYFRDVTNYCTGLMDLNLHDDQFMMKPIGHDDDIIGSLDQLHPCSHLFADIESLVYHDSDGFIWTSLDHLPAMFPKLTSLTLSTKISPLSLINSLSHLTSLHLFSLPVRTVIFESMPIFRQLKSFSLRHYYGKHVLSFLCKLGPNLSRLMLSDIILSPIQLAATLTLSPELTRITWNPSLATSVTHLTLRTNYFDDGTYPILLDIVCTHMVNLVYLHFYCINLKCLPSLAKLRHLTELHVSRFEVPKKLPHPLPQVKSVKKLHLTFSNTPTGAVNFQTLFPNVEEIFIYPEYNKYMKQAHKYMAQFRITCPVTFIKLDVEMYMGRYRRASRF